MHSNVTIKNVNWPYFSWPTLYIYAWKVTYCSIICHEEQQSIFPDSLEFKEDVVFARCITNLTVAGIASPIKLVNTRLNCLSYWPASTIQY